MEIRAAVLHNLNEPLVIENLTVCEPLARGQLLVKLAYSGVCHSQLMEARGKRGNDPYLPHLLGHEGSGTVIEVGEGVTKVKPGDRVILGWIKGDGMDVGGPKFRKGDQIINAGSVTTFSNFTIVSENRCVKLPDGVPLDVAVLFGCAIPTGAGIVINQIKPAPGSSIAVYGLGGIGLSALMAIGLYDCSRVIAVDVEEDKLKLAKEFGATDVINATRRDPLEAINGLTDNKGVDYCVEASGGIKSIEMAFRSVRKFGGLCVFASHPPAGIKLELDPYDLICGRKLEGTWGGASRPDEDIPRLASLYLEGRLPLEKLVSRTYTLDSINQALDDLETRKIVRALIAFTE